MSIGIEPLREMFLIEPVLAENWELFLQDQPQFLLCEAHNVFDSFLVIVQTLYTIVPSFFVM